MKHVNNGSCAKCQELFDKYPDFNEEFRGWFEEFQAEHPEVHISCAGRGKIDQEALYQRGATRAHYGQSAHNYGCAIDIFVMIPEENTIYPNAWFLNILEPKLPPWIQWGYRWTRFREMPHLEIKNWKQMKLDGLISLVE